MESANRKLLINNSRVNKNDKNVDNYTIFSFFVHPPSDPARGQVQFCRKKNSKRKQSTQTGFFRNNKTKTNDGSLFQRHL